MNKNYDPCMCGADDCEKCHPENFDNRGRYILDLSEDDYDYDSYGVDEDAANTKEIFWDAKD